MDGNVENVLGDAGHDLTRFFNNVFLSSSSTVRMQAPYRQKYCCALCFHQKNLNMENSNKSNYGGRHCRNVDLSDLTARSVLLCKEWDGDPCLPPFHAHAELNLTFQSQSVRAMAKPSPGEQGSRCDGVPWPGGCYRVHCWEISLVLTKDPSIH